MKIKYATNQLFFLFIIFISHVSYSQCGVVAPDDVTITCGSSSTFTATTTSVTYSVVASACAPIPITGTNAFPTTCDDCVTGQIPLGFSFNFYGNTYTTAVIQSNGILGFGAFTFTGYSAFAIPAMGNPNNYIAGYYADIDIRYGGSINYQTVGTAPNRKFIVSYDNVVPYNLGSSAGTGTASFQIIINEGGSFNTVISQLSANWYASTSGALATSGAENATGTLAFPVPGRNSVDFPGIVPTNLDCYLYNPQPCIFQKWQQGATVLSTNPTLTVSPTSTATYTGYWNCGASICADDIIVNVTPPDALSVTAVVQNTNCTTPNASISIRGKNYATYTVNYLNNGVAQSQTVTGGFTGITQGSTFNSGTLATTDLQWIRNSTGTVCNGSAGTTYYLDSFSFTPSVSGSYTFNMCAPTFDAYASLYQNAFSNTNPCGTPANFINADDDANGANCSLDPRIVAALTAGVTYYLISTTYSSAVVGAYSWSFTGPAGATIYNSSSEVPMTLINLPNGSYTNISIGTAPCASVISGPIVITGGKTWLGYSPNWSATSNWSGGVLPNATDCVIIPVTSNNPVISGANYNALAGTLTINTNASLIINATNTITVTDWVTVQTGGTFQMDNNSSLIQINNTSNIGNIKYKRNASVRNQDYVYWSSPVTGFNINSMFSPLTSPSIYLWNTTIVNPNGGQGNWQSATGNTMISGKGYIARVPETFSTTIASTLTGIFTGVPNNGMITVPISRGSDTTVATHYGTNGTLINNYSDNWNLIGNPYPSAIRASQFLFDNNTKIDGAIKIWTHGTLPSAIPSTFYATFATNYNPADYLTYNFTGVSCCPAAASDLFIGSSQGFFVQMKDGFAATDFVTFNNSLRSSSYSNASFFKSNETTQPTSNLIDLERNRIWIDIFNNNNDSDRALFGYIENATMDEDNLFDCKTFNNGLMAIYTLIGENRYLIQGRALPFDINDEVPLGVTIPTAGGYTIAISAVDGLFTTQSIYLRDTLLNIIFDIKTAPYSFSSIQGSINDRFKIIYTNGLLATQSFVSNNTVSIISDENLNVFASNEMESIIVYDVLGRLLANYQNINAINLKLTTIQKSNSTLLLQIKLKSGEIVNRKVLY